jgi:hypothetical protein
MTYATPGRWLFPIAMVLTLALSGCSGAPRPAAGAESRAGATGKSEDGAGGLERALGEALNRRDWNDLRIDTECRTEEGLRSATVFGSGVGIWNRERQLVLPRESVLALLRELAASGFPRMPETYGEGEGEVELICRIRLDLDGASKQVHQLAEGPQSPALKRLTGRILEAAEKAGRSGPGASSLTDGLEKIARGELAPELLMVYVVRQSEAPGAVAGWELGLEGSKASLLRYPLAEDAQPATLHLEAGQIADLAADLAAARLEELPVNLWAPEYTDLTVTVLNRKRSFQARQFAGMTPTTHGEAQQRFERLWEALDALNRRLSAED